MAWGVNFHMISITSWARKLRFWQTNIDRKIQWCLGKSTTFLQLPAATKPLWMMILYACTNINSNYNDVLHLYYSEQPFILSHIVIIYANSSFCSFKNLIICLLFVAVVTAFFFCRMTKMSETHNSLKYLCTYR